MTGYGKAVAELADRRLTLEIKSLNSKQLDLSLKIPSFLREKEPELRNMISRSLDRGKVDLMVNCENRSDAGSYSINFELARRYQAEMKKLLLELREDCPSGLLPMILRMPDVVQSAREELSGTDWEIIQEALDRVLVQVSDFRKGEGEMMEREIRKNVATILENLAMVAPLEKQRIPLIREKIMKEFGKWTASETTGPIADRNRFEQELIYYLEKLDITEEKVRLQKHCEYFLSTLDEQASQGKKLGFITQEMGREINTLGSKASDAGIQRLVVEMKDELEKIREQLGNVL